MLKGSALLIVEKGIYYCYITKRVSFDIMLHVSVNTLLLPISYVLYYLEPLLNRLLLNPSGRNLILTPIEPQSSNLCPIHHTSE